MNRPFDAARYAGMLEGLEITELPLSQVRYENRVFRTDAQYFSKTALRIEQEIKRGDWAELSQVALRVESFGAYALTNEFSYVEEGVPFLRCLNIRNGFTDFSDVLHITPVANKLLAKSEVRPGMVLLTMSGSVGNASVALPNWKYPINSNQDIAKITPKIGVDAHYIAAFLGSRYGRVQMERLPVGSVQQHIFLWMIERLLLRRLSKDLEHKIGQMVADAYRSEEQAVSRIQEAEQMLLSDLGLANWQPSQPLSYVRSSREAFAATRLDAEYFAPRVAELLQYLRKGDQSIRDVAPARHERFVADVGRFDYIEIGGICADGTVIAETLDQSDAPSRATSYVRCGDVITSTVRPIRGLSALITPAQDRNVCSSGFVVLKPQRVAPEVLLTYLRLPPICELLDLHTSASLYPAISEQDLLAMPFPVINALVADDIVTSVRAAQSGRRRAIELLDAAKRAVEIAIEEDERAAMAHIYSVEGNRS